MEEQNENIQPVDKSQSTEVDEKKAVVQGEQLRPLTKRERAYLEAIKNPKTTKTEAVRQSYNVKPDIRRRTLENMAAAIEKRPPVMAVLNEYAVKAEKQLVELADTSVMYSRTGTKEGASYAQVSEKVLNSILDRVHGKATQRVDLNTTSLTISIDLSSDEPVTEVE